MLGWVYLAETNWDSGGMGAEDGEFDHAEEDDVDF